MISDFEKGMVFLCDTDERLELVLKTDSERYWYLGFQKHSGFVGIYYDYISEMKSILGYYTQLDYKEEKQK